MIHLGDTHHQLIRQNVQLVTRARIRITSPSAPIQSASVQDLVRLGLWITRGNGLDLRLHIDFSAFAHSPTFLNDVLCGTLPQAKLWSQLSLKASVISPYPARRQPFEPFEIAFALTHHNLPQSEYPLPVTGSHRAIIDTPCDASPPMGVLRGSIDSIELTLILTPLASLSLTTQPFSATRFPFHAPQECSPSVAVRFMKERSFTTTPYGFSDHSSINTEKSDQQLLFQPYQSDSLPPEDLSIDKNEKGLDESGMVRLSRWHTQQSPYRCLSQPSVYKRSWTVPPYMTCQPTLDSPAFMRLIDLSLRHTVGGTLSWRKDPKRSSTDAQPSELVKAVSDVSLADISPALFRPGYMKAVSQRAHLISRIASSISNVKFRSRIRGHCTTDPGPTSSSTMRSPAKPSKLQVRLWHLLQKRKWPTEPLESLVEGTRSTHHPYEKEGELILDTDEYESVPWEASCTEIEGGLMPDPDMDSVGAMDDDDDDDEDLFSVYERAPFSSQESTGFEMMLESSDVDEEIMLEEDLLLCTERCHQLSSASFPAEAKYDFTKTADGARCNEDIGFVPLEHGGKDGEDSASMMLF